MEEGLDSDLNSGLLRPCINTPTKLNNKLKFHNQNHLLSQLFTPPFPLSPQTLIPPPIRRRIPGPAGVAQAAMERMRECLCGDDHGVDDVVSTQECVRMAVENGCGIGEDGYGDFSLGPWKRATEFLNRDGRLPRAVPLISFHKLRDVGRVDLLVAVIKSCTPNGLGDLMVTLKHPSGIVKASIHRKVVVDKEFGKEICVGSVLILQKVAIFAPSRSVLYLNITRNNVVKVFSKDSGPPTKENTYVSPVKPTSGHHKETSDKVKEVSSVMVEITQGISRGRGEYGNFIGSVYNQKEMGRENNIKFSNCGDRFDTSAEKLSKNLFRKVTTVNEQRGQDSVANLDENQSVERMTRANGTEKEKETLTATATLPEWTDEQLNELFTAEYTDGAYSFLY